MTGPFMKMSSHMYVYFSVLFVKIMLISNCYVKIHCIISLHHHLT